MLPSFSLGAVQINTYRIIATFALLTSAVIGMVRLLRHRYSTSQLLEGTSLVVLGGVIGAYMVPALEEALGSVFDGGGASWTDLIHRAETAGLSFPGALLGGVAVAVAYCRWQHLPLGRTFDLGGIGVPLGQAIGRLGCFCAGCCHGRLTDSWIGLYLPDSRGLWAVRYPTELLSAAVDLLIFVFLVGFERLQKRQPGNRDGTPFYGFLFLLYVELYCCKRFAIEFLRDTPSMLVGPFSWAHVISGAGFVAALFLIFWNLHSGLSCKRALSE